MSTEGSSVAAAQFPAAGQLNLDHVACFVPRIDDAARVFAQLGFTLTPFSAQSHRITPDGPLVPAGTGNRCIMLKHGYIECLTPTDDTPVADQLRTAIARYTGLHLIAFGTATPDADHRRLAASGFAPPQPVALQRVIGTPDGEQTARFTVVRVAPGTMAEGRIQFCQQHTPELLWQSRWLTHPNRADALTTVILCVADPAATAARYARFTGLPATERGIDWVLQTARGHLLFTSRTAIKAKFDIEPPALPWIVGCVLASADMTATRTHLSAAGFQYDFLGRQRITVMLPPAVGGIVIFEPEGSDTLSL